MLLGLLSVLVVALGVDSVEVLLDAGASCVVDGCALLVAGAPSSCFLPHPMAPNITTPQASKANVFFILTSI